MLCYHRARDIKENTSQEALDITAHHALGDLLFPSATTLLLWFRHLFVTRALGLCPAPSPPSLLLSLRDPPDYLAQEIPLVIRLDDLLEVLSRYSFGAFVLSHIVTFGYEGDHEHFQCLSHGNWCLLGNLADLLISLHDALDARRWKSGFDRRGDDRRLCSRR